MGGKFVITGAGYRSLRAQEQALEASIRARKKHGRAAGNERKEHTGDGISFITTDAERDDLNDRKFLARIRETLGSSEIAPVPTTIDRLQVCNTVKIQRFNKHGKELREPELYLVVGYEESDFDGDIPRISYESPIICQLMGKKVGASAFLKVRDEDIEVVILEIGLPKTEQLLQLASAA